MNACNCPSSHLTFDGQAHNMSCDRYYPPPDWPSFAAEDVDDLGLGLCLKLWQRLQRLKARI